MSRGRRRVRRGRATGCLFLILLLAAAWLLPWQDLIERGKNYFFPRDYEAEIRAICAEHDIDPTLVQAVIREESDYKADAESSAGACGLMQLMPDTAAWIIEKAEFAMTLEQGLWDPVSNIRLGVWYLHWLQKTYYPSYGMAATLAAYNAGHATVDDWIAEGVWNGSAADAGNIPFAETRQYVQYVFRSREIYLKIYG